MTVEQVASRGEFGLRSESELAGDLGLVISLLCASMPFSIKWG